MGYSAKCADENPYYRARKEAAKFNDRLFSREGASELIGCSVSTLSDYELGLTKNVPPDRVCKMADLYRAPELKGLYCLNECPIGKDLPISGRVKTIEQIAIQISRGLSSRCVEQIKDDLLDIASDGKITEDEQTKAEKKMQEVTDDGIKSIDEQTAKKDKEIMEV